MRPTGQLIAGILLTVLGLIWILQGLDRFPGESGMNGQREWVVIGIIVAIAGVVIIYAGRRPRRE
ncbi:MAG: hypothetical protein ACR2LS_03475 [Thermomicrobiales bacterium]|jgi:uncharacterized membrane protein YphA (DoxX/SURF4 family)